MGDNEERTSAEPLMSQDKREDSDSEWQWSPEIRRPKPQRNLISWCILLLPWFLLFLLSFWNLFQYQRNKTNTNINPSQQIYSPVQHLLEYEVRTFNKGTKDASLYVGEPSPELDQAWLDLYPSLYQLISQEQAAQLVNQTVILPHEPDRHYVIELDVFHQLHCLNQIRQALRPDYYQSTVPGTVNGHVEDLLLGPRHASHCVEIIRQAIMCAVDVTPYTWRWSEEHQTLENRVFTPHTCRNFEKIREWALPENHGGNLTLGFDFKYREMNDPLDPETWVNGYSGE